ncbi:hypothetical protein ACFOOK_28390 [Micromonospora krabiensis]|uniref:Uncharacterized protein n=1 Tax=Micromonospora krabiensis TaxID=307121 RepID=A0A1C3N4L0_9ACTN|nr:hypothetical protein [Micromonospora krabiensis]SBV27514.1 hypothetical protein GA0070620_3033 [Micromonospora krabiensis]
MDRTPALLVDTSTLLSLRLDTFARGGYTPSWEAAALECLVLFDRVLLDGPTIRANRERLLWTTEMGPGFQVLDLDPQAVSDLYLRGAELFQQMQGERLRYLLPRSPTPPALALEYPGARFSLSTNWDDVMYSLDRLPETRAVLRAFTKAFGWQPRLSGHGPLLLIRLFYYLALQETVGSALLVDHNKAYYDNSPGYGYASRILGVFSDQVRGAYLERKEKWLGSPQPTVPAPLLAQYLTATAERRGWSLGRVIAWLREQPEVHSFRAGMTALMDATERGEARAIDDIMAELDEAAEQWSARLGTPIHRRTIPVTVALPFVEGQVRVPIPAVPRTPGRKLLVFINMLLSSD